MDNQTGKSSFDLEGCGTGGEVCEFAAEVVVVR